MEKRRVWSEESRLMLQGFEQLMFEHDWIDTDVVALLDDDDLKLNEEYPDNG